MEDTEDLGMVIDGNKFYFTDAMCFADRLRGMIDDPISGEENAPQIVSMFPTLLSGAALRWYQTELENSERINIRQRGINGALDSLMKRFPPNIVEVTNKWNDGKFFLRQMVATTPP
ncbi:hypothetical protein QBC35DRAFT_396894 [Podospora australis]|uniref:Uncharacterized protein n=1 Tax=Podospora australis TaxID=1536484 RepID=A0AAN6WIP6_9PEZI|nr:hypothetical protein QBC35DRAFT_396894 [Podospora australis]